MYLKLAVKNLLTHKTRTLLTSISLAIGICSLALILSLSDGLKSAIYSNVTERSPLNQIMVQTDSKQSGFLKLLDREQNSIKETTLEEIKKIPHVTEIHPEISYNNFSSLQINILGQTFQTDSLIFGLSYDFLQKDLENKISKEDWDNAKGGPYPVVISKRILDLYNFTVATTNNLPTFSENNIIGREITILPDSSTFFGGNAEIKTTIQGKIVALSDKVNLTGVTLPLSAVQHLNKNHNDQYQNSYFHVYLLIDSPEHIPQVTKELEKLGLKTTTSEEFLKNIETNFRIVTQGLSLISLIIILVSALNIANSFFAASAERKTEIGIFRAVGAKQNQILKLFLLEAVLLGFTGGGIGLIITFLLQLPLDRIILNSLPTISTKPETVFLNTPLMFLLCLGLSIVVSSSAALLPSYKASRQVPLKSLTNS